MSIRSLVNEMVENAKQSHYDRQEALSDFYLYKSLMANSPLSGDEEMLDMAETLIGTYEGEIECGEPGNCLSKFGRGVMFGMLAAVELIAVILALSALNTVTHSFVGTLLPVIFAAVIVIGSVLDILFFRLVYDRVGTLVLKNRIYKLDRWRAKAARTVVLDRHHDEAVELGAKI